MAATIGYTQHPLLFRPDEYAVKWLLTLSSLALAASLVWPRPLPSQDDANAVEEDTVAGPSVSSRASTRRASRQADVSARGVSKLRAGQWWRWYLVGFVPLEAYCAYGHALVWGARHRAFLPLMLTSVYCGLGISCAWARMFVEYVSLCRNRA